MKALAISLTCIALVGLVVLPAAATTLGAQVAYGSDSDLGFGVRAYIPTEDVISNTRCLGEFNWFFPDENSAGADLTWFELNANLHWMLRNVDSGKFNLYVGTGINMTHVSVGNNDDSELGLNLVGGAELDREDFTLFTEIRFVLSDADQGILSFGLRF